MKSEERQELKENDLANWIQYGLPIFLKQNGSYIVLAFALALLGYQLWNRHQNTLEVEKQNAWNELSAIEISGAENAPAKLQSIISQYNVKPVQAIAWLEIGNYYLNLIAQGMPPEAMGKMKITQDQALEQADAAYKHILNEFADEPLVLGSAHMGLAAVAENKYNFDEAKKQFEILTDKNGPFAGTAFAAVAEKKLAELDTLKKAPHLAALVPPPTTEPAIEPAIEPATQPIATSLPALSPAIGPSLPATAPAK